jgi:homogentisate phytyltransferase/homogentisate geranylgeranyltransferase
MVYAMVPALLMNLYITGLNQITDVDIDKVNKPDLPLAAGDWTVRRGTLVVVTSLILSAVSSVLPPYSTPGLHVALGFSAILGTVYSLPPLRLKRFPFLAAFCIVAVRGAVINAGFYSHAQVAAFGTAANIGIATVWKCLTTDMMCMLSSLYFAVFGVVIALMKDVPDVKGDDLANVRTFSVRLGPSMVFKSMHRLLTGLFWGVGLAFFKLAVSSPTATTNGVIVPWTVRLGRAVVAIFAILAGVSVQKEAKTVDPESSKEVYGFYMHLWKLFYLSYFVLPFAR